MHLCYSRRGPRCSETVKNAVNVVNAVSHYVDLFQQPEGRQYKMLMDVQCGLCKAGMAKNRREPPKELVLPSSSEKEGVIEGQIPCHLRVALASCTPLLSTSSSFHRGG